MTIIKRYGAPAAFPDTIVLDLEPAIDYPAGNLLGAYRFKGSYSFSAEPKAGSWPAFTIVGDGVAPAFDAQSVTCSGQLLALQGTALPETGDLTFGVVVRQAQQDGSPAATQFLVGSTGAAAAVLGLLRGATGTLAMSAGGTNAGFAAAGGDRFELFFGSYNRATGEVSAYRPRTGDSATQAAAAGIVNTASVRLSGPVAGSFSGYTREAWNCVYNRLLTTAEMDALYASLRTSLAAGGVEI